MAPPRLQCLNASRQLLKSRKGVKAMFSTTSSRKADNKDKSSPAPLDPLSTDYTPEQLKDLALGRAPLRSASSGADVLNAVRNSTLRAPSESKPFQNPIDLALRPREPRRHDTTNLANMLLTSENRAAVRQTPAARDADNQVDLHQMDLGKKLAQRIWRKWKAGDTYAPHDLSSMEMKKWRFGKNAPTDDFDHLNMNPLDHYRNFKLVSDYMSPMGRIRGIRDTGLRPVNQRKIAKAVRRMIGMGMMPSVHRHPEVIYKERATQDGGNRIHVQ